MSEKDSKPNVPIIQEQLLKAIEELLKKKEFELEGLKTGQVQKKKGGSVGSLIDVPLYRDEKPTVISIINKFISRLGYVNGGYMGQMDKPLYYSEPGIVPTIKSFRQSFSDGGVPEDIVQIQMLIGILENAQGLSLLEQKLLEELYQDLGRVSGGSK
jgi:hypothetical protein